MVNFRRACDANRTEDHFLLLSYPNADLQAATQDVKTSIAGADGLTGPQKRLLERLADDIGGLDLYDAQERYVFLFDRTRSLSLHLFEHVHGESRDRGQAMVDLLAMYEADGLLIDAKEMPDYLPLFLEYLSIKPDAEAAELLGQTGHILKVLRERLKKRQSVYANAFAVLEALASGKRTRNWCVSSWRRPKTIRPISKRSTESGRRRP